MDKTLKEQLRNQNVAAKIERLHEYTLELLGAKDEISSRATYFEGHLLLPYLNLVVKNLDVISEELKDRFLAIIKIIDIYLKTQNSERIIPIVNEMNYITVPIEYRLVVGDLIEEIKNMEGVSEFFKPPTNEA